MSIIRTLRILSRCCRRPSKLCTGSRERLSVPTGGGWPHLFSNPCIAPFIKKGGDQLTPDHVFRYVDYVDDIGCLAYPLEQGFVYANLTLANIVPLISIQMVQKIAQIHKISFSRHWNLKKNDLVKMFEGHNCLNCTLYTSILEARLSPSLVKKEASAKVFAKKTKKERTELNKL
jgi:hypothetical protein